MNQDLVIKKLQTKYPGKFIIENRKDGEVIEILCEVEPTSDHPEWSLAIAIIDKSIPHKHLKTTETYEVIEGELTVHLDNEAQILKKGESLTIKPGITHWAEGNETWVECTSKPGWTSEDHLVVRS